MITSTLNWRKPGELETFNVPLLCWTGNKKCLTFKDCDNDKSKWIWLVDKYNIKYWVFQSELDPE